MNTTIIILLLLACGIVGYAFGVYMGIKICRQYPILTMQKNKKMELKK